MSTVKINELGAGTPVSTDLVPFADPTTGLAEKATLTQVASVVEPLLTGKADLNGNSAEQFEVADATSSTQAVSKNQLDVAINALQGSLIPQGNWNASTNTPNISGTTTTGYYWIVSVAGSTNLDGITDWKVNDWAIKTATGWAKIDNSEPVTSVAGKTGAVTLDLDDVSDSATRFALTNTTQSINGAKTFSSLLAANGGVTSDGDLDLTADGKVNVAKTLTTLDQKVTGEVQATSFAGDGSKLRNVQIESPATPSDQQLSYGNSEMQNYLRVQDAAGFNVDAPNSGGWTIAKDKKIGIRPSIRLIPSAIKTNILPSQLPRNGNGNFTFGRTSTAQTVDFDGFIVTTGSGSPRIDYLDGEESLLLEPATTNLITYSEDFSDASWAYVSASSIANQSLSPDGSINAFSIVASGGRMQVPVSVIATNTYTMSLFVKSNISDSFSMLVIDGSNPTVSFNLNSETFTESNGATGKIENYGNGWYRCSLTMTATSTGGIVFRFVQSTDGIYIFGAQLEQQSYATSYIPTSGSTATRNAETCNGAGTTAEINSQEGVLFGDFRAIADSQTFRSIAISDGTSTQRVSFNYNTTSNQISGFIRDTTGTLLSQAVDLVDITNYHKFALKYSNGDFKFYINGLLVAVSSTARIFASNVLNELAFDNGSGLDDFYGRCKRLSVYNSALTDSQLEALTGFGSFAEMKSYLSYS